MWCESISNAHVAPADRDRLVFEPSAADELPGRRILLDELALCRVVPDPSDPRPLPNVVRRWIEATVNGIRTPGDLLVDLPPRVIVGHRPLAVNAAAMA